MKVFFTASYKGKKTHQKNYNKIIEVLEKNKVEIISLELQKYEDLLSKSDLKKLTEREIHYLFVRKGIYKARAVIIEASIDNFRLGHEATLALLYNKPVLCLSDNRDYTKYIKDPGFYAKRYKKLSDLESLIQKFLKEVRNKYLSVRMDVTVGAEHKNFIKWYAERENSNVSEVIRDMINNRMKQTKEYSEDIKKLDLKRNKSETL